MELLAKPLTLPCGAVLKNRLAKSCMSDSLGRGDGEPTAAQVRLYERWAEGGVSLSCIGEVQSDPRYPEKPGNLVLPLSLDVDTTAAALSLFRELARRGTVQGAHLWPQLGHAGALTHLPINGIPKGPSALNIPGSVHCEAMSTEDILALPKVYAQAAQTAQALGFSGVLIHAGHGFLLSQFLSPLFNARTDEYGGTIDNRCQIVLDVILAVRNAVGPSFPVGVRINSSDQLVGGLTEEDALEALKLLDKTTIDLIDISGGTYFPGAQAATDSTTHRGKPYFLDFCRRARQITTKPLMLTGGFKQRQQAIDALKSGAVDVIGLARAMALNPCLAKDWITNVEVVDPSFPRFPTTVPGGVTAWFTMRLTALAEDREDDFDLDLATAVQQYDERDARRTIQWKKKFQI